MENLTEIQALQNFGDKLGLKIHEQFTQDKRRKIKKYFAARNGTSVSPVLNYNDLNHFLLGWSNCSKTIITSKTGDPILCNNII